MNTDGMFHSLAKKKTVQIILATAKSLLPCDSRGELSVQQAAIDPTQLRIWMEKKRRAETKGNSRLICSLNCYLTLHNDETVLCLVCPESRWLFFFPRTFFFYSSLYSFPSHKKLLQHWNHIAIVMLEAVKNQRPKTEIQRQCLLTTTRELFLSAMKAKS